MNKRIGHAKARRKATTFMAAAAAALTATFTLVGAGAASAAEYDYPAAIDPASIVVTTEDGSDTVTQEERVRVDAAWSVPDGAMGGETFGFTLPPEFERVGMTFSVPSSEDPSQTIAECAVSNDSPAVVTCTLTDYVNGRTDVNGTLWFEARAHSTTTNATVGFTVAGSVTPVQLPGDGIGVYVPKPASTLPTEPTKWSWQTDDGRIAWEVLVPGAQFQDSDSIVISDTLVGADAEFAEHHNEDTELYVWTTNLVNQDPQPNTNWTGKWNADGTAFDLKIAGPIDPTRVYYIKYFTVPSSMAPGSTYSNIADINGVTIDDDLSWTVTGGGAGDGDASGAFLLNKVVEGSGVSDVPTDTLYTVSYSYGDPAVERTIDLTAGVFSSLVQLPTGTVVTLEEITPQAIDGVVWEAPVFSGAGVTVLDNGDAQITIGSASPTVVTLTNTASMMPALDPPIVDPPVVDPPVAEEPVDAPTAVTPPSIELPTELPLTDGSSLARTGGDTPAGMLWIGGAALALGVALTVLGAARSRARQSQD